MKLKFALVICVAVLTVGLAAWDAAHPSAQGTEPAASVMIAPTAPSHVASAALILPSSNDTLDAANAPAVEPPFHPYPFYVHVPSNASADQPLQVVIALHGMGGEGKSFSATLVKEADRHHWLLIAPTIHYGDWHNPDAVATEDIEVTQRLLATINALPSQTGYKVRPRVDVYGFSRGAQVAHRFALFFPEKVERVAAFSAGTYTLPSSEKNFDRHGSPDILNLPYGIADLRWQLGHALDPQHVAQVYFLIGVGGADNAAADVPRQWDPYLGSTRVERAHQFTNAMQRAGMHCTLQVFPGVGHEVTQAMLNQAVSFFSDGESRFPSHIN